MQQYKVRVRHEYGNRHPRLRTFALLALAGGVVFVWFAPLTAAEFARFVLGLLLDIASAVAVFVVNVVA